MKAFIKPYLPVSEYAKSKQPVRNRHSDAKKLYAYFVEYGSMVFGPFFSEKSADSFLTKQGFSLNVDETGLYYESKYKGDAQINLENNYEKD